eukprot:2299296-Prymnesium_polylepis.1
MRECRQCGGAVSVLSQGPPPRFSRARVALFTTGRGSGMRNCCNCGDECGRTAATEGAGGVRRDCCTTGEGLEQARGCGHCGEGLVEVVNACDAAVNGRERGCCDRCCTAANG